MVIFSYRHILFFACLLFLWGRSKKSEGTVSSFINFNQSLHLSFFQTILPNHYQQSFNFRGIGNIIPGGIKIFTAGSFINVVEPDAVWLLDLDPDPGRPLRAGLKNTGIKQVG
jgi:hypothetical protein